MRAPKGEVYLDIASTQKPCPKLSSYTSATVNTLRWPGAVFRSLNMRASQANQTVLTLISGRVSGHGSNVTKPFCKRVNVKIAWIKIAYFGQRIGVDETDPVAVSLYIAVVDQLS